MSFYEVKFQSEIAFSKNLSMNVWSKNDKSKLTHHPFFWHHLQFVLQQTQKPRIWISIVFDKALFNYGKIINNLLIKIKSFINKLTRKI